LVTGQVWADGMAVPTSSSGSMSQTGTVTWSGGTTTQGAGGTGGAGYYFTDASTISGSNVYGAVSGSGTWTVPSGINTLQVVIVGGGGNGYASKNGSGGGAGYIKGITLNVTAGTQIPWSVGGPATQSCFNGVCAAPGQNGTASKGGDGGSGGGCGSGWATLGGGGGGGLGGVAGSAFGSCGNGCSGTACCAYDGGGNGNSAFCPINTSYAGVGQGYASVVTGAISAIPLSGGTQTLMPLPSGERNGGTGYGAGGGGTGVFSSGTYRGAYGANGAIFVWAQ
ncbi:MAG: hypothetical protein PHT07_09925, partial [Paludibacter sp.]|nr:hypothetical protein [Paludibacter sp.]